MKIAVIGAKGLPPKQGGIEHHCAEICSRLVAQGHSVDFFARSNWTHFPAFHRHDFRGVQVISLPCSSLRGTDAFTSAALGALLTLGDRYDIVHFHSLGPALFSWLPHVFSSAKVVVTCHGLDWQRAKWNKLASGLIWLGEKVAVNVADEIVVVSDILQLYFLKTYGRDVSHIPNAPATYDASDPDFTYATTGLGLEPGRYIVFLGRLVPEKCPDLLIQAFKQLQPLGWKLVLVGAHDDPSFKSKLLDLSAGNPNIVFAGELRGRYLAELVRGAGLFVLPSNLEGLPLALLEAMHEGIPVLASNIPPHLQLLGSDRGLLFRSEDFESCVEQLNWAMQHLQKMQDMAQKAQTYVKMLYNWDEITNDYLTLYEQLLNLPHRLAVKTKVPVKAN
jgi:glycosyltransferase involved in cell wall biosynthesis